MFTGIGFNVNSAFKTIAKATLDIKVKQLNFTEDGGRPAAAAMNSWVANKTDGKTDSIIFPSKYRARATFGFPACSLNSKIWKFLLQTP